jgi:hypothetical protein
MSKHDIPTTKIHKYVQLDKGISYTDISYMAINPTNCQALDIAFMGSKAANVAYIQGVVCHEGLGTSRLV